MTNSIVKSRKEEVIRLLLNEDTSGIEILSDRYSKYLMLFINRCVKHEDTARSILEKTYSVIKTKISEFDDEREIFLRWMARIALEESIESLKMRKRYLSLNSVTTNVANRIAC